jgi:hypothetical protein
MEEEKIVFEREGFSWGHVVLIVQSMVAEVLHVSSPPQVPSAGPAYR